MNKLPIALFALVAFASATALRGGAVLTKPDTEITLDNWHTDRVDTLGRDRIGSCSMTDYQKDNGKICNCDENWSKVIRDALPEAEKSIGKAIKYLEGALKGNAQYKGHYVMWFGTYVSSDASALLKYFRIMKSKFPDQKVVCNIGGDNTASKSGYRSCALGSEEDQEATAIFSGTKCRSGTKECGRANAVVQGGFIKGYPKKSAQFPNNKGTIRAGEVMNPNGNQIDLCVNGRWKANEGTDQEKTTKGGKSQTSVKLAATLVHEISHWHNVWGTNDNAYGEEKCLALAKDHTKPWVSSAKNNAASIAFFASLEPGVTKGIWFE